MKLFKNFSVWIFPLLILLMCSILAWRNYVPGTILSGWDTLHPEFNFWEYFLRSLNGVWMQHQGLGAVASQAHPSELTRLPIIFILKLFIPLNLVRYSFFFLCLTIGVLGIYFFSNFLLSLKWKKYTNSASFLSSLFYLFNLTVVQQFYVPLEMFAVHYAALPWLLFFAARYIQKTGKKNLLWFAVVTLFSSSMAHTATLFYVYLLVLWLFTVFISFKKSIVLIGLTILINSFWLLPNLYFIKNHSLEVSDSKIHTIFTGEAILQSEAFGTISDLALSKNFLFNWNGFDFQNNEFVDLLSVWKDHFNKPYVIGIGYLLFGLAIFGFFVSMFGKSKYLLALVLPFLISIFFWINSNYPFEKIYDFFQSNILLVREGVRFPFTKFSITTTMILSLWFGCGSRLLIDVFTKIKIGLIYLFIVAAGLIYFQLPQFQGYLISPLMKVQVPNEYYQLFNWFNNQNQSNRVARLPMDSYWGWQYNLWKYEGAGFSWFGIKQPILEREFDRWSPYNETFYNQTSLALYNNQSENFRQILKKYQVRYLLLDESIITAGGDQSLLRIPDIKNTLANLGYEKVFNFNFLTVYDTGIITNDFISTPQNYSFIDADTTYSPVDLIFEKFGDYVSKSTTNNQQSKILSYPFVNFDNRSEVEIGILNNELRIKNKTTNSEIKLEIKDKLEENFDINHGYENSKNCDLKEKGKVERYQLEKGRRYVASDGGVACDYFVFGDAKYDTAYVLHIKGVNKEGRSLKIYLYNWETKRVEVEELLPEDDFDEYYVIYPKPTTKSGYTLNVETRSFGKVASENLVDTLELLPFDYNLVTSRNKGEGEKPQKQHNNLKINKVNKIGTAIYKVDIQGYAMPAGRQGLLQLGQGYEKGWMAIKIGKNQLNDFKLLEHVKINGWSNGWIISQSQSEPVSTVVYILFWPQFLEWFGFLVLLLTGVVLVLKLRT